MVRKKKEAGMEEILTSIKYAWRHRQGFNIKGKRYLDNHIPGLILDVFDNLDYEQKDKQKPVISAKRQTEYGWHLIINLPPGVSFGQVKGHKDFFQDATNSWINLVWRYGKVHMDIYAGSFPEGEVPFAWNPEPYLSKMDLPIPIGVHQSGLEVVDLAVIPHLLVGGATNWGKSNFLHALIAALLQLETIVIVIDHKRLDFGYLRDLCLLAKREKETETILEALDREMERRFDLLEAADVVKIQEYEGNLPYIVVVIDELAECNSDAVMGLLDRLARLSRAVGIHVVAATQRPSTKIINGDTRSNFPARLCFQMADESSSRVILGENCSAAAWLPAIKGRAIWKFGLSEREVQTMYLPHARAKELANSMRGRTVEGWEMNVNQQVREPQAKRLKAR
jgi:S-DNA-T family DNA segregation ATPase FtsK/SpoIIIE